MKVLYKNTKIAIGKSSVHGWGVFATNDIFTDEILEEVPYLELPIKNGETSSLFIDYRFNYPQGSGSQWEKQVIPYGFACLYNHSNNANAGWYTRDNLFVFKANRLIKKGEEIFTYYGDNTYWDDGRKNINVL